MYSIISKYVSLIIKKYRASEPTGKVRNFKKNKSKRLKLEKQLEEDFGKFIENIDMSLFSPSNNSLWKSPQPEVVNENHPSASS